MGISSRGTNTFAPSALDGLLKLVNSIGGCIGGGWGSALSTFLILVSNSGERHCFREVEDSLGVGGGLNV